MHTRTPPLAGDVAVIGMAGRYPLADDLTTFWENLKEGVDATGEIPATRWDWREVFDPHPKRAGRSYSRWGAFISGVEEFDPDFFRVRRDEAAGLDPQLRLFFEVAWETLEDAGYAGQKLAGGRTGLWVGYGHDHYLQRRAGADASQAFGMSETTALANRFSSFMDWGGPSIVVNTLCSSSLVAVHMAVQSLLSGECEEAIAGGVHAALSPAYYVAMSRLGALSPTGKCRAFDAAADGYVPGEGCGAVMLKPLTAALSDGDHIHGVIKATSVNHNGRSGGTFALNLAAQKRLVAQALGRAGVGPETISYVEAHAVGTCLGDAIEVTALTRAFAEHTSSRAYCALGSLKPQIGHLESAAGIAGLHKLLLSLKHRQLPPCAVNQLNPLINLDGSPFVLNERLRDWEASGVPRRAGVSAFGMYGVNAHVIVEEAPPPAGVRDVPERPFQLFSLSARSDEALRSLAGRHAEHLRKRPGAKLADVCYTANVGRGQFAHRLALTARSAGELEEKLAAFARRVPSASSASVAARVREGARPALGFLFDICADGATRVWNLSGTPQLFRQEMGRCLELLAHVLRDDPPPTEAGAHLRPHHARPYGFALSYSLARLLRAWGVEPAFVSGLGPCEFIAACVSGAMELADGLELATTFGRLPEAAGASHGAPPVAERPAPLAGQFLEAAARIRGITPSPPFVSSLCDACGASPEGEHRLRCLEEPPRREVLSRLGEAGCTVLLKIGGACEDEEPPSLTVVPLQTDADGFWPSVIPALARLWLAGAHVDWEAFEEGFVRRRTPLPTYPFERQRYWLDETPQAEAAVAAGPLPRAASSAEPQEARLQRALLRLIRSAFPETELRDGGSSFLEANFDSIRLLACSDLLARELGVPLSPVLLFEHLTAERLAAYLLEQHQPACESFLARAASDSTLQPRSKA